MTDKSSSFLVNTDAVPNFGDYINVAAAGGAIYATWTDGRNGDPDVFFSSVAKDTAPFVLLQSFSLDDSGSNGDGDGVPEPGESPRLKVALRNPGAGAATHVSAMLTAGTPGITIVQGESAYGDLSVPGSTAPAQSLYQFRVDPSLECSRTVVCPPISTLIYGVDPGGTVVRFAFDTGLSASVPTPGDQPSGGPDGLAVQSPTDAFWVSGFGMDRIIEFNPQTGEQIPGPFPIPSPGAPNCTDGLALAAPTRLFSQNFCEGKLYEIDTRTGLVANDSLPGGLGLVGGLAGGDGRLFATVFGTTIAEIDPHSGAVLNSFLTPDLNGDGFPDTVFGLAFDGTYLLAASVSAPPPNVAALDPANGKLVAVSPFRAPSGFLSALDAVAGPSGSVCVAGTFRTVVDFELAIATDQGPFSSSQSIPLGREAKTTAFRDNVESGINGWTPTGDWHQTTDRAASSSTHAWYFGRENGPGLRDNAYGDSSAGDLTSPLIDLSGARSAALVFDQYLARELCCDFATVSASGDGFRTQTMLASLDPAVDPSFSEVRLDLSAFAGSSTVQVRFTFRSDPSVDFEGWYVDNIRVQQSTFDCGLEIGLTTTTTLPAFRCQRDADCDDGDPCTTDDCAAGQCVFSPLGGSARAQCKFDSALNNPLCGSTDRVDPRLEHFVTAQLRKAKRLLQVHASGTPKQINRLIRRVDRELLAVLTRVGKARRMGRISAGCRDMIEGRINELRQAIAGLRS